MVGSIFDFPNFFPKINAEVSQIQTDRNVKNIKSSETFLIAIMLPKQIPSQNTPNIVEEILSNGLGLFLKISKIESSKKDITKKWKTEEGFSRKEYPKSTNKLNIIIRERLMLPPSCSTSFLYSIVHKITTIQEKIENSHPPK